METETIETATEQDTEYQPVRRDVTLRFYRHPKVKFAEFHAALRSDEIEIERNGVKQVDLHTYTEVTFQADKE
jgi:RecA-family ATPase